MLTAEDMVVILPGAIAAGLAIGAAWQLFCDFTVGDGEEYRNPLTQNVGGQVEQAHRIEDLPRADWWRVIGGRRG